MKTLKHSFSMDELTSMTPSNGSVENQIRDILISKGFRFNTKKFSELIKTYRNDETNTIHCEQQLEED